LISEKGRHRERSEQGTSQKRTRTTTRNQALSETTNPEARPSATIRAKPCRAGREGQVEKGGTDHPSVLPVFWRFWRNPRAAVRLLGLWPIGGPQVADTSVQTEVERWVRSNWLPREYGCQFRRDEVGLSSGGVHSFGAVSEDGRIVASISTSSAMTPAGRSSVRPAARAASALRRCRTICSGECFFPFGMVLVLSRPFRGPVQDSHSMWYGWRGAFH